MTGDQSQHVLVEKSAFAIMSGTMFITAVRPIIVDQHIIFTWLGILYSVLSIILYFIIDKTKKSSASKYWVIGFGFAELFPLLLLSGGVNSPFIFILPIIPLMVGLLSNTRVAVSLMIFIFLFVLVVLRIDDYLPNYSPVIADENHSRARAFWLIVACIISTGFAAEFSRLNQTLNSSLYKQANMDELTELPNRRSILAYLTHACLRARDKQKPLTVMMLDVDFFKKINDQYGHLIGDKALIHIADILQSHSRSETDGLGRYGGEEFLIVLPNVGRVAAQHIADKILKTIESTPLAVNGIEIKLTATIGYYSSKEDEDVSVEAILSYADQALYLGKKLGRNRSEYFLSTLT
ncbi:GGDEF domain-containing protein [Reinekea thalattae]|uniref:diguanylate cyclase n=1 Tax=Reinekea thalattae TaxID=2593301 RepID=A0A5C8ZBQ3_9GAMM|nr:GGDEF domain-containing protein [Reinekea thalattae]TXR54326.1 GGDEF domain-containing protein [Reinekea thalattae]